MGSLLRKAVLRNSWQVYATLVVRFWSILLTFRKSMEVAVGQRPGRLFRCSNIAAHSPSIVATAPLQ